MLKLFKRLLPTPPVNESKLSQAFDKFYEGLLRSKQFPKLQSLISGIEIPAYNLLSRVEINSLKDWISECSTGRILDFGCGLGFVARFNQEKSLDWTGIDFSKKAISFCQQTFPSGTWICEGLPLQLKSEYDYLLILDSLYHPQKERGQWVKSLLQKINKKAFIIQNIKKDENFPELEGWSLTVTDTTDSFHQGLRQTSDFLEKEDVQEEWISNALLWDTISKENQRHLSQRDDYKRVLIQYEKINS